MKNLDDPQNWLVCGRVLSPSEKRIASSLKWWIDHPAKPLPAAKSVKGIPSIGSWRRPAGWKKK